MTDVQSIAATLQFVAGLALLWWLFFRAFHYYRLDALRDRLFAVREELFDYAAGGAIAFNDPAYGKLRNLINGLIRFAHRLSFSSILPVVLFRLMFKDPEPEQPLDAWRRAVVRVSPEVQKKLWSIHNRALAIALRHMVIGNPLVFALLCICYVISGFKGNGPQADRIADLPGVRAWEAQVIEEDHEERHQDEREKVFA